jgi:hypothetical protein
MLARNIESLSRSCWAKLNDLMRKQSRRGWKKRVGPSVTISKNNSSISTSWRMNIGDNRAGCVGPCKGMQIPRTSMPSLRSTKEMPDLLSYYGFWTYFGQTPDLGAHLLFLPKFVRLGYPTPMWFCSECLGNLPSGLPREKPAPCPHFLGRIVNIHC